MGDARHSPVLPPTLMPIDFTPAAPCQLKEAAPCQCPGHLKTRAQHSRRTAHASTGRKSDNVLVGAARRTVLVGARRTVPAGARRAGRPEERNGPGRAVRSASECGTSRRPRHRPLGPLGTRRPRFGPQPRPEIAPHGADPRNRARSWPASGLPGPVGGLGHRSESCAVPHAWPGGEPVRPRRPWPQGGPKERQPRRPVRRVRRAAAALLPGCAS